MLGPDRRPSPPPTTRRRRGASPSGDHGSGRTEPSPLLVRSGLSGETVARTRGNDATTDPSPIGGAGDQQGRRPGSWRRPVGTTEGVGPDHSHTPRDDTSSSHQSRRPTVDRGGASRGLHVHFREALGSILVPARSPRGAAVLPGTAPGGSQGALRWQGAPNGVTSGPPPTGTGPVRAASLLPHPQTNPPPWLPHPGRSITRSGGDSTYSTFAAHSTQRTESGRASSLAGGIAAPQVTQLP
jgi:hypothetical protein